ncbi:MAG: DUF427 domain-containing protein [Actinomycetota bacterium]
MVAKIEPGPGQESVWDYPRPPRLERSRKHVVVRFNGETIASSTRAFRVLETSSPPTYYIPRDDVRMERLTPVDRTTFCEWKGDASYFDIVAGDRSSHRAAWTYDDPTPAFREIKDAIAFYPGRVDECTLDGEAVRPQAGKYYGGWVTDDIVGPFKGEPGTEGW